MTGLIFYASELLGCYFIPLSDWGWYFLPLSHKSTIFWLLYIGLLYTAHYLLIVCFLYFFIRMLFYASYSLFSGASLLPCIYLIGGNHASVACSDIYHFSHFIFMSLTLDLWVYLLTWALNSIMLRLMITTTHFLEEYPYYFQVLVDTWLVYTPCLQFSNQ